MEYSPSFQRYDGGGARVPIIRVSSPRRPAMHRFYDTSPISPSGKFVTFTEFARDDVLPKPGDEAYVVVVDLTTANEVYRTSTAAWDTQLGAQPQWGDSDSALYFNRMDTDQWVPYGVRVDIHSGSEIRLAGTIYMVSPDGRYSISPDLVRIWSVQPGYGVVTPPAASKTLNVASADDGVFITDLCSGESRVLVSFEDICTTLPDDFGSFDHAKGDFFGFHTKWSPDGNRIFFLVRWKERDSKKRSLNWIITMRADGSDLRVAIRPRQWVGGHHPNWCPDSEHIVMNLVLPNGPRSIGRIRRLTDRLARRFSMPLYRPASAIRLATFRYDGSDLRPVSSTHLGSGHPTWHQGLNAVLTDAYPWEAVAPGDGTSPIRLIFAETDQLETLVNIPTTPPYSGPNREWRVDPHPAWSRDAHSFAFNGCPDGVRGVFIADMSGLIASAR